MSRRNPIRQRTASHWTGDESAVAGSHPACGASTMVGAVGDLSFVTCRRCLRVALGRVTSVARASARLTEIAAVSR